MVTEANHHFTGHIRRLATLLSWCARGQQECPYSLLATHINGRNTGWESRFYGTNTSLPKQGRKWVEPWLLPPPPYAPTISAEELGGTSYMADAVCFLPGAEG